MAVVVRLPEPPGRSIEEVGRVLRDLRSALDQAFHGLIEPTGVLPFPICSDPVGLGAHMRAQDLHGASPRAQGVVAGLQPYPGRNQALALLRDLDDMYDDRSLQLALAVENGRAPTVEARWDQPLREHLARRKRATTHASRE